MELLAEGADFLLVLLADLAVLCLEVVERLADDVELVYLAGYWGSESGYDVVRRRGVKIIRCVNVGDTW